MVEAPTEDVARGVAAQLAEVVRTELALTLSYALTR